MAENRSDAPMGHSHTSAMPKPGTPRDAAFRGGQALVWGGVALGVAGLTAASVLSVRRLTERPERPENPEEAPQPVQAPRFADLTDEEREAIRRRVRAQAREDYAAAARERAEAGARRRKRGKGNAAKDLTKTAAELTASLTGVATAVATASKAFRSVSGEAPGVMGDFIAAADQLRALLNGSPNVQPAQKAGDQGDRGL